MKEVEKGVFYSSEKVDILIWKNKRENGNTIPSYSRIIICGFCTSSTIPIGDIVYPSCSLYKKKCHKIPTSSDKINIVTTGLDKNISKRKSSFLDKDVYDKKTFFILEKISSSKVSMKKVYICMIVINDKSKNMNFYKKKLLKHLEYLFLQK